jgi:Serine/threonine protein phosphatase
LDQYVPLQLNREHTLGVALDERAWMGKISFEDAEENMYREALSSSIGGARVRRVDLPNDTTKFLSSDKLVLMSDGIYRSVSDSELSEALMLSPDKACDAIVERILKKKLPQQDNMSIVIVERGLTRGSVHYDATDFI